MPARVCVHVHLSNLGAKTLLVLGQNQGPVYVYLCVCLLLTGLYSVLSESALFKITPHC